MKIPFYKIIGPIFRKNKTFIQKVCASTLVGSHSVVYTGVLGFFGAILSLYDLILVLKCGTILPEYLQRSRLECKRMIHPETERDLKLLALFIAFEYYCLVFVGVLVSNVVLFFPFLALYCLVILAEFTNLILKILVDGVYSIKKMQLFTSSFLIVNWIMVFCAFERMTKSCDL